MDSLASKFTDASAFQYLSALILLLWLLLMARFFKLSVSGEQSEGPPPRLMFRWFTIAVFSTALAYAALSWYQGSADLKIIHRVVDGDTIILADNTRIRFHGIDTPEYDQPFGHEATAHLESILGEEVHVENIDIDRYGRTVAVVRTPEGLNVNLKMVCDGYAWWYERYAKNNRPMSACQAEAREAGLGLWESDNPMPPWEWRRR